MRIALLGYSGETHLKACYGRAFKGNGHEVLEIDYDRFYQQQIRWGTVGKLLSRVRAPSSWAHYANRKILGELLEFQPELTCVFGNFDVSLGMLAYLKNSTKCRLVLIWPDPLFSIHSHLFPAARILDAVATYGKHTIESFREFGYRDAFWLPFGGDDLVHFNGTSDGNYDCDLSFVGGWRPERQQALEYVLKARPSLKLEVHGPNWKKICHGSPIQPFCGNDPVVGKGYANLCARSRICLNVIDKYNFPAANMRFFELPTAGALQLTSLCPEMEGQFLHREHVVYFSSNDDLVEQVSWILDHDEEASRIRLAARQLASEVHSYGVRAEQMLAALNMEGVADGP